MNSSRLAWPLLISLVLHLCIAWLFSPGGTSYLPRSAKAVTLTVVLPSKERSVLPSVSPAPALPTVVSAAAGTPETKGTLTKPARFLAPPDLTDLEEIEVPVSGRLTLRLQVSALGTVDRVTIIKSDPMPKELLDGLLSRFGHARLAPAQSGSKAVASTLDLVVRYETAPTVLPSER